MKTLSLTLVSCLLLTACSSESDDASTDESIDWKIESLSPTFEQFIAPNAQVEVLASGFTWSEGPLWLESQQKLIFSDVPENKIYQWNPSNDSLSVYLTPSGYTGSETQSKEPGSNGLALDPDGNLVLCQHGNRQLALMASPLTQPEPEFLTLASTYKEQSFNSPNDVAISSKGSYFFTDPPYGLNDPSESDLGHFGVYRLDADGNVELLIDSLTRPNGIALSPDEETLYIAVSDPEAARYYAYQLDENQQVTNGKMLLDVTALGKERKGLPDGMKVHSSGNLFATGPGGVLVLSPEGEHLGTIMTGFATANCAFDSEEKYLYMTAHKHLMRIALID
ncbi:SMP-30/gluconolactonase/LRE family protein [Marinoscillum furvescens]|uniref:Gluconolactonase n=1 Tax=Marinoscillum furvescens DSM 4134 TaxID=1122208 RepID=A0A3D9KX71_MARFU|nr:SMP-30/gluconolactonase/LRE family protein [Marinoscillum furvescens]RED92044.1 gluconolactonase [Marinoscillum furvescens DSM 4134]